jgi:peptide chain release factor 2
MYAPLGVPSQHLAQCQNERSQHRNRDMAMKFLRSRLYELELRKRRGAADKLEAAKAHIDFGSQIRSYVLHPCRLIKDHRTKFEMGDTDRVLDGDLDPFLKAYLLSRRSLAKPA